LKTPSRSVNRGVEYRTAVPEDIPQVARVFASAIDDLNRKHGFFDVPTPFTPPNPQYAFWLDKDPAAFWVAELDRRVVGYAFSFLRGSLWFLADLFILPVFQGRGIGGTLIQKTLGSWGSRRITNRALITPAFNRASVSLYMRFGMLPRQPVYFATASKETVARTFGSERFDVLEVEEVDLTERSVQELAVIHRRALGFPPGWHNEFFSEVQNARCLLFTRNGRKEGYAYFRDNGRVGPLVVKSVSFFRPALQATLRLAAEGEANEFTIFFAGTNREAVLASMKHGFRITYPLLFLSSRPMGDWSNYLFYSPGLM